MSSKRLLDIFERMAAHERNGDERGILCSVAREITRMSGASIALSIDDASLIGFCASDALASSLVDLELMVSEGPCSQAIETNAVASCADLAGHNPDWMLFTPEAVALGLRSVVAVPIRIGAIRYGALCLYSLEPGELSVEQSTDALLMASVVGRGIVALQAGARPETLSGELQSEANFDFSVHQAAGMVAVQASISISNALISLRMHAFAISEALVDVAARVIARQLHFDAVIQEWVES
jgi:GAF domain-containing protein